MRILLTITISFLGFGLYACSNNLTCGTNHYENYLKATSSSDFISTTIAYIQEELLSNNALDLIVWDPGHGGKDNGCKGTNSIEKNITLQLSIKLKEVLNYALPTIEVVLTREEDVFLSLHERAKIANDLNADLFLSIHCNYLKDDGKFNGSETYVMGLHTAEENLVVAKRENEAINLEEFHEQNYDGYDPNSPEGHILLSMFQHAYFEKSILLSKCIEDEMDNIPLLKSNGVKQAGFVVLKLTTMPSALLEIGYLSNHSNQELLNSENGRANISYAIYKGIEKYKAKDQLEASNLTADELKTITYTGTDSLSYKILVLKSGLNNKEVNQKLTQLSLAFEPVIKENKLQYLSSGFIDERAAKAFQKQLLALGFDKTTLLKYKNGEVIK